MHAWPDSGQEIEMADGGKLEKSYDLSSSSPSKRLAVLQGHLKSAAGSRCVAGGAGKVSVSSRPCAGGSKTDIQSSAPMSSSKDEVQKAFPRQR